MRPNAFETECREKWDATYDEESYPGVPSGDNLETSDGRTLTNDFAQNECTMLPLLRQALRGAGENLTHESLHKAFLNIGCGAGALISDGEGELRQGQAVLRDEDPVRAAPVRTPPMQALDANGQTYNGCPAPVNCWIPITGEWVELPRS